MKFFLFILVALSIASTTFANTWYVEKDGSTAYTTIQSAVNAAASGDTIRIGPGLYNDIHVLPEPLETEMAVVHVPLEKLTILGAGAGQTIIGQNIPWEHTQGYPRGIHGGNALENGNLFIEGVCIQNLYHGILFEGGGSLSVENCFFQGSHGDMALYTPAPVLGDKLFIENCIFEDIGEISGNYHIWSHDQDLLIVRNCQFTMEEVGLSNHILCSGRKTIVEQCNFFEGREAIGTVCEITDIRDCLFDGQGDWGLKADTGFITVEDCIFRNQFGAIYSNDYHQNVQWAIQRVIVENVTDSTFRYHSLGPGYFTDCILAKGPRFVVRSYNVNGSGGTKTHFDMTNNWWGTTDPDSIQAWIHDAVDEPEIGYFIDWLPFKDEPLPTEKKSLGGFRSMFR